jgi:hypothetical protein
MAIQLRFFAIGKGCDMIFSGKDQMENKMLES